MESLERTLLASPIPSLSALTGQVRPATAAAFLEKAYKDLNRQPRRAWSVANANAPLHDVLCLPGPFTTTPQPHKTQGAQVGSLVSAASKQLDTLDKAPGTPYKQQRAITPQQREQLKAQLKALASAIKEANINAAAAGEGQEGGGVDPLKPGTPGPTSTSLKDRRPGTALPLQDMVMPRPSTTPGGRLGRNLPGVAASWSGPLPTGGAPYGGMGAPPGSAGGLRPGSSMGAPWAGAAGAGAGMQPELNGVARSGTPPRTPGTPQRLRSRGAGPLRASAPAPLSALADVLAAAHGQGSAGPGAEVWVNPGSLPGVSAEQRERALLRSSMGNRAVADATGSASSAAAAASAFSRMLHAQQGVPHGALPSQAQAEAARSAAAAAGGEGAGRRGGKGGAVAPPIKLPRRGTGPNQSALEHFAPTRGMVYSVFKELDEADTGKLTWSQFEDAAVVVGLKKEQAQRLFSRLDRSGLGYVTVREWGDKETERQMMDFCRLYVQQTRGASGRPPDVKEVRSAALAVQVAMSRLHVRNSGRSISMAKLMEAFEFIDWDGSGSLSLEEMRDAFNGMGIYVTQEVLDEIMDKFDANKNGTIEYNEFIGTLFPTLSKSLQMA